MTIEKLIIGEKKFNSRLLLGTGKYHTIPIMKESLVASQSEIITVAIRRLKFSPNDQDKNIITHIDWNNFWLLPNTAGAKTIDEAIRIAFLGRELTKRIGQIDNNFVKLEVISDSKYLLPDPIGTLRAAEFLVKKGFIVLPYTNTDPMLAKHLEDVGCATIMPLASPIGSGQGLQSRENLQIIIENSHVPVIIDAGIGSPSDASLAMELGADAVLVNTAIAQAKNSIKMAKAMRLGVKAGRYSFLSGRIKKLQHAQSSSSLRGTSFL